MACRYRFRFQCLDLPLLRTIKASKVTFFILLRQAVELYVRNNYVYILVVYLLNCVGFSYASLIDMIIVYAVMGHFVT